MWEQPIAELKCPILCTNHLDKGCWFILTAGQWPRKPAPAKKCVTTYLPNGPAPKMDGAKVHNKQQEKHFYFYFFSMLILCHQHAENVPACADE